MIVAASVHGAPSHPPPAVLVAAALASSSEATALSRPMRKQEREVNGMSACSRGSTACGGRFACLDRFLGPVRARVPFGYPARPHVPVVVLLTPPRVPSRFSSRNSSEGLGWSLALQLVEVLHLGDVLRDDDAAAVAGVRAEPLRASRWRSGSRVFHAHTPLSAGRCWWR